MDNEITLPQHEAHSEQRAAKLGEQIKEKKMSAPHVNVFPGMGGDHGGASTAATIAALGHRNQDGGMAALAPLAMMNHGGLGGGGFAAGALGFVAGAVLSGRGRGGLLGGDGGGDGGCGQAAFDQTILNGVNGLTAAVPTVGLQTQIAINGSIGALALGTQQGLSNVKDAVQNIGGVNLAATGGVKDAVQSAFAILNQNILEQGCQNRAVTLAATTQILQKLDQNTIDDLRERTARAERSIEVNALASRVEVNQTVNTTTLQNQQQAQGQFQIQALLDEVRACRREVAFVHQEARATNGNVIAGNTGAVTTGAQTSTPTNVNA